MFKILEKEAVAHNVWKYVIAASDVAKKAQPGQFVVLRLHEQGERIPISISDWDRDAGTITLIVQLLAIQPSS